MIRGSSCASLLAGVAIVLSTLPVSAGSGARNTPRLAVTIGLALWTMGADGRDRHRLTRNSTAYSPELSPNDQQVAYDRIADACSPPIPAGSRGPAPRPNLLVVLPASGPGPTWQVCGNNPSWSPAGRLLALFNRETLVVRSSAGLSPRILLQPDRFYGYVNAVWSPDSQRLVVPLYGPGSGLFEDRTLRLAIVPLAGRVQRISIRFPAGALGQNGWENPRAQGSFPTYSHLTWTGDGRHLLVETLANGTTARLTGIWEASVNGGTAHLVAGTPADVREQTRPEAALDHATGFALSPDGAKLATDPHGRLWVGNLAGHQGRLLTPPGCRVQQLRWLADSMSLAYIAECAAGGTTSVLATISLPSRQPRILVRSGSGSLDLNSRFLCISCG